MLEEVKKQATKTSNDDKKDEGKLIEKTEEEDEILQEASWDTYAKVLKQSGGIIFWLPFGAFVIANVFLWEQCNGFWTRFADKSPEDQQQNLNWYVAQALFFMFAETFSNMFIETTQMNIANSMRKHYYGSILKRLMHAPVNLYHDITPVSRVMKYLNEDIHKMDWYFFHLVANFVANKIRIALILGQALLALPQLTPFFGLFVYIQVKT